MTGPGTKSGTAAGDSCTGNNLKFTDLEKFFFYKVKPGPEILEFKYSSFSQDQDLEGKLKFFFCFSLTFSNQFKSLQRIVHCGTNNIWRNTINFAKEPNSTIMLTL